MMSSKQLPVYTLKSHKNEHFVFILLVCIQSTRMEVTKLLLFIQMLVLSTPIQSTNYVKSNNSSLHKCPGSCLTLDEFIDDSTRYFTAGLTFIFLPGNHSQRNELNMSNISGMIWRGNNSRSNNVIILSSGSLHCYNVTDFIIEGLNFINISILYFTRSTILLSSLVFISNTGNMATTERAVQLNRSNITIINTSFEGIRGGAVMATDHSTLTLIDTAFIGNEVPEGHSGGAIYCANSTINMTGNNSINNNLAKSAGGAIYCKNSTITMTENTFLNNNHAWKGGAVMIWRGSLIIIGNANFSENEASIGGALYLSKSHALINGTDTDFISTYSTATFNGSTNFLNNQGGIVSRDSSLEFSGDTLFYNNS